MRPDKLAAVYYRLLSVLKFALVPGISLISTVLILPLISRQFGAEGWIALTIGQSVGALAGVAICLGWAILGANEVAAAPAPVRTWLARSSLITRGVMLAICILPCAALVVVLVPSHHLSAVMFTIGTTLNGFTFSWFWAGTGRPGMLIRNEALIRLSGNLISIPLLYLTKQLWVYALVLIISGVGMVLMNALSTARGPTRGILDAQTVRRQIVEQLPLTGSRIVLAAGTYLTPSLVAALSPRLLDSYSALDRIQKAGSNASDAIPAGLQSWVSEPEPETVARWRRVRYSFWFIMIAAGLIILAWIPLGAFVTDVLFAGNVKVGPVSQMLNGAGIACYFAFTALSALVMVPSQHTKVITIAPTIGAIVSLGVTALGVTFYGLAGALAGPVAGYLVSIVTYTTVHLRDQRPVIDE